MCRATSSAITGCRALRGQPVLDLGEPADVEEGAQQPAAVLRLGAQEACEVALREQHHLAELLGREPQPGAQVLRPLVDPGADRVPVGPGPALHGELGLLGRPAVAALLGPLLLGTADHAEPFAAEGDLAGDLGADVGAGVVAAEPLLLPARARHRAVEREHDGVEQRRLAGAGRTPEQEQPVAPDLVEVDLHGVGERAERREGQRVQPHAIRLRARGGGERPAEQVALGGCGRHAADPADELPHDLHVAAAAQPLLVAACRRRPPGRRPTRGGRSAGTGACSRRIGSVGRTGSVSRAETKCASTSACSGSASSSSSSPVEQRQRARGRQRHGPHLGQAGGVEVDQPGLLLLPGLTEGVRER